MKRRIAIPALMIGLALCFAALALPVQPVSATHALQGTEAPTIDPCNPKPAVPGTIVGDSLVVFSKASQSSLPLIFVKKGDVVSVLGRSTSGVWIKITTNAGVDGWVPSAYILITKDKLGKLAVVDDSAAATAVATAAETEAATMEGTQAALACPGVPGTITADAISLKTGPATKSKDEGTVLKKGAQVQVIKLNSTGSWFEISVQDHQGWVGSAYVFVQPGSLANIGHDYSDAEVTLTPAP